ncbi:MAG: YheU family protein [Bdellovibrionaceae bacterium]|nr:YheU family protein [Pseudobdellovibrionaceae bacterium]
MNEDKEILPPVEVPREVISDDAFQSIIESFILREGTDYGADEVSLSAKIHQIEKQLIKGDVKIVFDPNSESVSIITQREWTKLSNQS